MLPGVAGSGFTVTAKFVDIGPLPQALVPLTVIFPEVAKVEKFKVMLLVLLPLAIVAPEGSVHAYPVA